MHQLEKRRKFLGIRIAAIWETLLFLFILCLGNFLFGNGDRFIDYRPHPFWVIILLTSSLYGTVEGVFAAICSILALYAFNVPEMKAEETLFQYEARIGLIPMLWLLTAFVLGEIRLALEAKLRKYREQSIHDNSKAERIAAEYASLKEQNEQLALSLTSREETASSAFRVFKALEALEPARIITGLDEIVQLSLKPKKFSVFAKGPNGLEAVTSEGWAPTDKYSRRFKPDTALYKAIVDERRFVCVINADEQPILGLEGILASPLINPDSNEVFGMIKAEEMTFKNLNFIQIETFKTVCDLIGRAYANSKKHKLMSEHTIFGSNPLVYSFSLFKVNKEYFMQLSKEQYFSFAELQIQFKNQEPSEKEIHLIKNALPIEALIYQGMRKQELRILVPLKKTITVDTLMEPLTFMENQILFNGQVHEKA